MGFSLSANRYGHHRCKTCLSPNEAVSNRNWEWKSPVLASLGFSLEFCENFRTLGSFFIGPREFSVFYWDRLRSKLDHRFEKIIAFMYFRAHSLVRLLFQTTSRSFVFNWMTGDFQFFSLKIYARCWPTGSISQFLTRDRTIGIWFRSLLVRIRMVHSKCSTPKFTSCGWK
jgi:hypothetical protein